MKAVSRNDYFDQESGTWDGRYSANRHFQARLTKALEWVPSSSGPLQLLDYGCGSGVLMRSLLERGHSVTGIDASAGMIRSAQQLLQAKCGDFKGRYRLLQSDQVNSQFVTPASMDGVYCLGVIEYLDNPTELIRQFAVSLKPNGTLIISYPNASSLLRTTEKFIYHNPALFRTLGMFPHLTTSESYLAFQKQVFAYKKLEADFRALGLVNGEHYFHVAPTFLGSLEQHYRIGMTVISKYQKGNIASP